MDWMTLKAFIHWCLWETNNIWHKVQRKDVENLQYKREKKQIGGDFCTLPLFMFLINSHLPLLIIKPIFGICLWIDKNL